MRQITRGMVERERNEGYVKEKGMNQLMRDEPDESGHGGKGKGGRVKGEEKGKGKGV